jgi:hypothetical protein
MDKVRSATTDPNIIGKDWASPMLAHIKQRTDDLQQRIKDYPHMLPCNIVTCRDVIALIIHMLMGAATS